MTHALRTPIRRLWIVLLIAALMLPALGGIAPAQAALPVPGMDGRSAAIQAGPQALRPQTTQAVLEARARRSMDWLGEWMAGREQRPAVDPAAQSQTVADWTVMVFIAADNNLEIAGLADLNEMEAVGSSPRVNILAEIDRSAEYTDWDGDWTETRRYYVQQDKDPERITSPLMQNLGEVNSGSAEAVADFAIWGITNYPAQKYMLVLWDHGGSWMSHSSDEDTGDDITLLELTTALNRVKTQTGVDKFEVIGFDMCLMGQLEVFQAVTPYARYAIGSEENEPGAGWFYVFLDELVKNPAMTGKELGPHVVDYFMYFLREVVGDQDVYGLAAVDLAQTPALVSAVTQFGAAVAQNPQAALSAIADARNNTISYGGFNDPQTQDFWSSADLYQFVDLLAQLTQVQSLKTSAQGVMQAVQSFVIKEDHVPALDGSHGVSIYFPKNKKVFSYFAERYVTEAPREMAPWNDFLNVFHGTATTTVTSAPQVSIVGVYPEVASIYDPAVILLEIAGRDILQVNYAVSYFANNDPRQRVVLDFDYLISRTTTASGADIVDWSDGVTTYTFAWEAEVPILTDGTAQTYALLVPNKDNPDSALVNGYYRSVRGGDAVQAQLLFDLNTRQSTALWGLNQTASGNLQPFELTVEAGDTFTPEWLTLDENNQLSGSSLGEVLTLTSATSITFEKVPAPTGSYSISFVAENVAGDNTLSEALLQVNNDGLDPALRGYTDLSYGVTFLYPANWIRPRFTPDGQRLFTGELTTNTLMSLYPYTGVTSAEETDAAIRASWNTLQNLTIIQQQAVEINGLPAYVTDYSYTFQGAARTGAVVAIYVPDQGVGYAFDIDAPAANTEPAQQALRALVQSIRFFNPRSELGESTWQTATLADGLVSFPVPATWGQEQSDGWTIYGPASDERIFVALVSGSASGQSNAQLAEYWLGQLQSGVQGLTVLASEPFYIGGREWHVVVFRYEADVTIGGAFFTTSAGGQDITFWLEAPDAQFDQLYTDIFSVVLGGFVFNG